MSTLKNIILCSLSVFVLAGFLTPAFAADFAVSPMMIEMEGVERSTHDFEFSIFGRDDARIKLDLFEMNQLETGYMGFIKAEDDANESMTNWIELERKNYDVREGETTTVRGSLTVPARAAGTYLVGVMVEEDIPEEEQGGITVRVRYAVVLNMRVAGSRNARVKSSFEELVAVNQEDGIYLQGMFDSEATTDEWLVSQVQIRDANNRLVERVEMKTESAWQRQDPASRVFPGAKVRLFGKLTEDVVSGDYKVLVRNRFADKSQPVYRDTIRLEADSSDQELADGSTDASTEGSEKPTVEMSPAAVAVDIRQNGTSFSTFFLTNNSDAELTVELPKELGDLESKGIKDFQFYPDALVIAPNQKTRVVLKQTHNEEAQYGDINFPARVLSNNQELPPGTLSIATKGGS